MTFASWFLDPETTLELAAIQRFTKCSLPEAVSILHQRDTMDAIDALGMELGVRGIETLPEQDEEEET